MNRIFPLKTRQICLFFIAFLPVNKLFIMPSIVAATARQDMWMSALINMAIDAATLAVIMFICAKRNIDFYSILENTFGKTGSKIILSFYFVFFMLKAVLPISEQRDFVTLTFYFTRPGGFIFLPFFLAAFYLCLKPLRCVGRCADLLFIPTIIGFVFLIFLSFGNFELGALLPFGINGAAPIFEGSYIASPWYGDCVYYLFFAGRYLHKKKDGVKILLSYIAACAMVLIFIVVFYGTFSVIAFRQRFAINEISKYSTIINNIGRFDYLSTFMLLISGVVSLSLPLYFAGEIMNRNTEIKKPWIFPLIVSAITLAVLVVLEQYFASIEKFITGYASAYFILLGNLFPIVAALFSLKEKKHEIYQS